VSGRVTARALARRANRADWSEEEVQLIRAEYVSIPEREVLGKPVNKREHRKALRPQQAGRSDGSIEFKHTNSSAVFALLAALLALGLAARW
jgi:hypothetical protein